MIQKLQTLGFKWVENLKEFTLKKVANLGEKLLGFESEFHLCDMGTDSLAYEMETEDLYRLDLTHWIIN